MPDAMPLPADVPCAKCDYDLRGLTPPGSCPECGHDLNASIRVAWLAPPAADARWVKHVTEGVWCVLGAFAVVAAVGVATGSHGAWVAAVAALIAWAVTLIGCWKVARLEPLERGVSAAVGTAKTLRIASVVGLVTAIGGLTPPFRQSAIVHMMVAVGIVMNVAFYLRVRQIALHLGAVSLAGQALIISVLSASMTFAVAPTWGQVPASFFSVTGWGGFLRYIVNWGAWRDLNGLYGLISWPVVMTACQVAVLVQLLVALHRARRRDIDPP